MSFLGTLFGESDAELEKAKELKRLRAQEQRMVDMLAKYTDMFQRGKSKAMIINIINDIDKVLGEGQNERNGRVLR